MPPCYHSYDSISTTSKGPRSVLGGPTDCANAARRSRASSFSQHARRTTSNKRSFKAMSAVQLLAGAWFACLHQPTHTGALALRARHWSLPATVEGTQACALAHSPPSGVFPPASCPCPLYSTPLISLPPSLELACRYLAAHPRWWLQVNMGTFEGLIPTSNLELS